MATARRTRRTGRSAAISPTLARTLSLTRTLARTRTLILALTPTPTQTLALTLTFTLTFALTRSLGCQANWPCLPHAAQEPGGADLASQVRPLALALTLTQP